MNCSFSTGWNYTDSVQGDVNGVQNSITSEEIQKEDLFQELLKLMKFV